MAVCRNHASVNRNTYLVDGKKMTRSDQIHRFILEAKARNNTQELIGIIEHFFDRVDLSDWTIESIKSHSDGSCDIRLHRNGEASFCLTRSRHGAWRLPSRWISDGEACEILGVHMQYIQAIADCADIMSEFYSSTARERNTLEALRKSIQQRDKLMKARESACLQDVAVKKEVKRRLQKSGKAAAKEIAKLRQKIHSLNSHATEGHYPPTPPGICELPSKRSTKAADDSPIPAAPGVYFAWSGDRVEYVGQSKNLKSRCRFGHENLLQGDIVSWLEFPLEQLNFAESYYIGILQPSRNFGVRAYGGL